MYYTDDPLADFDYYDAKEIERLSKLPTCAECGEPIQDEECYEINGEYICPDCLEENHKHWTEDVL